jgi:acetyl esterase/lipase
VKPPPFDPELIGALTAINRAIPPSVTPGLIAQMRVLSSAISELSPSIDTLRARVDVSELMVPGPLEASDLGLLILRPKDAPDLLPGVYFIHGGGMIAGTNRLGVGSLLNWMDAIPMVVVSVEYRLAPENPHPAPSEDCYAGLLWTAGHLDQLGIDPSRLVVAGGSAGGGLAAAVALMVRDRGGPSLAGQVLMRPMLDDRAITPSSRQLIGEGVWDRVSNATGWSALLGDAVGSDNVSPYAAPARATVLSGLPPAYIDVGSVDTFRDEDSDYARRIWEVGGSAELHVWAGGFHGFESANATARVSQAAAAARMNWLKRILQPPV